MYIYIYIYTHIEMMCVYIYIYISWVKAKALMYDLALLLCTARNASLPYVVMLRAAFDIILISITMIGCYVVLLIVI